ncbi:hypothetical protein D049_3082B, partial [Vibrio parahaemolyticus VPTS-2010]
AKVFMLRPNKILIQFSSMCFYRQFHHWKGRTCFETL